MGHEQCFIFKEVQLCSGKGGGGACSLTTSLGHSRRRRCCGCCCCCPRSCPTLGAIPKLHPDASASGSRLPTLSESLQLFGRDWESLGAKLCPQAHASATQPKKLSRWFTQLGVSSWQAESLKACSALKTERVFPSLKRSHLNRESGEEILFTFPRAPKHAF